METVTIPEENTALTNDKHPILYKRLRCSCGWSAMEFVWRSESRAKHHILFTHGKGWMKYHDAVEIVPWNLDV